MIGKKHVSRVFEALKCGKGSIILDQSHLIWLVIVDYNYIYNIYIYVCMYIYIYMSQVSNFRQRSPMKKTRLIATGRLEGSSGVLRQ